MTETKTYTREQLVSMLSGNSLKDYAAAVEYLNYNSPDKLGYQLDQELVERTVAALNFEQWADWDELDTFANNMMEILPKHSYLMQDSYPDRGYIGLAVFTDKLHNREIDFSGFSWIYSQNPRILFASSECGYFADKIEKDHPDDAAVMRKNKEILDLVGNAQMQIFYFLDGIKAGNWTKAMADGVYNILKIANADGKDTIIDGLSYNHEDPILHDMVMNQYLGLYKSTAQDLRAKGEKDRADEVEKERKKIEKFFLRHKEEE